MMDDFTINKLCAQAMELDPITINNGYLVIGIKPTRYVYNPLENDAQAMMLIKRFSLDIRRGCNKFYEVIFWDSYGLKLAHVRKDTDLNRAICECVANMQQAKNG